MLLMVVFSGAKGEKGPMLIPDDIASAAERHSSAAAAELSDKELR
jgi:hypothetical protein